MISTTQTLVRSRIVRIGQSPSPFFVHTEVASTERFSMLFRSTAAHLPAGVCGLLSAYWSPEGPYSPVIRLTASPVIVSRDGNCFAIAMTELLGRRLTFAGPAIEVIPDDLGRTLVAHELAHVYVHAAINFGILESLELNRYRSVVNSPAKLIECLEQFADERTASWGFDMVRLRQFADDYVTSAANSLQPFPRE